MRMPAQEQIDVAVMWLESNEGEGSEGEACRAVAEWLDHMATEAMLRRTARQNGVTTAQLRRKLGELQCKSQD